MKTRPLSLVPLILLLSMPLFGGEPGLPGSAVVVRCSLFQSQPTWFLVGGKFRDPEILANSIALYQKLGLEPEVTIEYASAIGEQTLLGCQRQLLTEIRRNLGPAEFKGKVRWVPQPSPPTS